MAIITTIPTVIQAKVFYTVGSANADYITDGVADEVQIQQANDAAGAAGGGTVFIKEGTYSLATGVVMSSAKVVLAGSGSGTLLQLAAAADSNIIEITANDTTVRDMKLDGNRTNVTTDHHGVNVNGASRTKLLNLSITEVVHHGIQSPSAIDLVIQNCTVNGVGKAASPTAHGVGIIAGSSATNTKIINCTVTSTAYHGVQLYRDSIQSFIANCHITNVGLVNTAGNGIEIHPGVQDSHISNCYIAIGGAGGAGLGSDSEVGKFPSGLLVENCTIEKFVCEGILLTGISNVVIKGNDIRNNGNGTSSTRDYGIRINEGVGPYNATDIQIINNNIYDNQGVPTQAQPLNVLGTSTDKVLIAGNICYGHVTSDTITIDIGITGVVKLIHNFEGSTLVDLPLADGGTAASDAATARTNLGLGTAATPTFAGLTINAASNQIIQLNDATNASAIWGENVGLVSGSGEGRIVGRSTVPLVFYTGGTLNSMTSGTEIGRFNSSGNFLFRGAAAHTCATDRHSTTNTAGSAFTIQSGGATIGATDKASGDMIMATGLATGVGRGLLKLQATSPVTSSAVPLASGTTDGILMDRHIVGAFKALTNASPINLVNFTLASNTVIGGIIRYAVEVFDGTNLQMETGESTYQCANKGGVFSGNTVTQIGSAKQFLGSGTLAMTWAITGANPAVLSLNANSSLTPSAGYPRITYTVENFTQQAVAIQ